MVDSQQEFYRSLPTKRMAAGVLFLNESAQVLLVEPTYKQHWEIPGGIVERDESPLAAVVREVHEELGLNIESRSLTLAGLDYIAGKGPKTEALMFVFHGGTLTDAQIQTLAPDRSELKSFRFVGRNELPALLGRSIAARVQRALTANANRGVAYFEGAY